MNFTEFAQKIKELGGRAYLVGGCVRDWLMGLEPNDIDICTIGITPETLENTFLKAKRILGDKEEQNVYVYLIQIEHQQIEVALGRREIKTGEGYKGFRFELAETIEEDLKRRDFTMNSVAKDMLTDEHIDPFNGKADIKNKLIRHTSMAFIEDSLRAYRAARFAARFGFTIADETKELLKSDMIRNEIPLIKPDRICGELKKVLSGTRPDFFFRVLKEADLLSFHFKEIEALVDVEQPPDHHPEGCSFEHSMQVLYQMCLLTDRPERRFAALVHDLGKGLTPKKYWPKHYGHEEAGVPLVKEMCRRLRLPKKWEQAGSFGAAMHGRFHRVGEMKPVKIVDMIEAAKRSPLGAEGLAQLALADQRGRNSSEAEHLYFDFFLEAADRISEVKGKKELEGKKAWEDKRNRQAKIVRDVVREWN